MSVYIGYAIVSAVLIIFGAIWLKFPPKSINSGIGFRTRKSSKSQRNWDKAQRMCGVQMLSIGLFSALFFSGVILLENLLRLDEVTLEYLLSIPAILLLISIVFINKRLPD